MNGATINDPLKKTKSDLTKCESKLKRNSEEKNSLSDYVYTYRYD